MNPHIDPFEHGLFLADEAMNLDEFGRPRTFTPEKPPEPPTPPPSPSLAKLPPKGPVGPSAAAEPEVEEDPHEEEARKHIEHLAKDG